MLKRRSGWMSMAVMAVLSVLLVGCPEGPPDDGDAAATVRMRGMAFSPASVTIRVGEKVRWVNEDLLLHSVSSGNPEDADAGSAFNSPTLFWGGSFEHTFEDEGTFTYFCREHPVEMRDATVIVEP